jgi:hypothetical protein
VIGWHAAPPLTPSLVVLLRINVGDALEREKRGAWAYNRLAPSDGLCLALDRTRSSAWPAADTLTCAACWNAGFSVDVRGPASAWPMWPKRSAWSGVGLMVEILEFLASRRSHRYDYDDITNRT